MHAPPLAIGERVSIMVQLSEGAFSSTSYTSKVEDKLSDTNFLLASPTGGNMTSWIGRKLLITVVRSTAVFSCFALAVGQRVDASVTFLEIQLLSDFEKVQRRSFYRLEVNLVVEIDNLGSFMTKDLSGSGMAIRSEKPMMKNDIINGLLRLPADTIRFRGRVVRCERVYQQEKPDHYLIGIKFIEMDRHVQDNICRFVHFQQIILRQKGILVNN